MLCILHGQKTIEQAGRFIARCGGVEFDLRMTTDHVVVVSHERLVSDEHGRSLWIDRLTYADVSQIDPSKSRFEDVLLHIQKMYKKRNRLVLELDIKQPSMESYVCGTLEKTNSFSFFSEIIISSPYVWVLNDYSEKNKKLSLGLTDAPLDKWDLWDIRIFRYITLFLQYTLKPIAFRLVRRKTSKKEIQIANIFHQLADKRLVDFLHEQNIRVFVYGARSEKRLRRLVALEVDGIKIKEPHLMETLVSHTL